MKIVAGVSYARNAIISEFTPDLFAVLPRWLEIPPALRQKLSLIAL